jgi:GTP-binding protein Era
MEHRAGFVNIIGKPNVGKSTLMNKLVGERLSIINSKAQTTRHRILGIVNKPEYQIVFSDTPGIIEPKYELQKSMMKFVNNAFVDADVIVLVVEVNDSIEGNSTIISRIKNLEIPKIVVINKIDLSDQEKLNGIVNGWINELPDAKIIPISALHQANINQLEECITDFLPEAPPYYPKDELTDKSERFFISEIIREKILTYYKKEVPYSVEVEIESFKEKPDIIDIRALIYVNRESQKGIIIGKGGLALKKVGSLARVDIEKFLNKKVFLEIYVKVKKNWREDKNQLKRFGYQE